MKLESHEAWTAIFHLVTHSRYWILGQLLTKAENMEEMARVNQKMLKHVKQ